jgi:hypothetical protein
MKATITLKPVLRGYYMAALDGIPAACCVANNYGSAIRGLREKFPQHFIDEPEPEFVKKIEVKTAELKARLRRLYEQWKIGQECHDGGMIVESILWQYILYDLVYGQSVDYDALAYRVATNLRGDFSEAWYQGVVLGFDKVWQEVCHICVLSAEEYEREKLKE